MPDLFQNLIAQSDRILITSHTSPDPDAVSSLLLLGTALELNFPGKQIHMVLEEEPDSLEFLKGYEQIKFMPLIQALNDFKPELFVIVDANSYGRVSRKDGQQVREYIHQNGVKTAIIDHHEPADKDDTDVFINSQAAAAVQEVYDLCFNQLNLQKPDGYAETTMLGLYSDTGGFVYSANHYKETFALVGELIAAGVNIEQVKNQLNQYSEDSMKVIAELANNLNHQDDYSYTFIRDKFIEDWQASRKPLPALHSARKKFVDDYIRNISGRQWGFVISLDSHEPGHVYSVSLRSIGGVKDVSAIANKLEGGGHKPAAGCKVEAASLDEALQKLKQVIAQTD